MSKAYLEVLGAILFVTFATIAMYSQLADVAFFWNEQLAWSIGLIVCWAVVSAGYFHQGLIIRKARSATHVSIILPIAVFIVQCILFVKGIYYKDFSLILGAVMVNCGVTFNLYQIIKFKSRSLV
jgi:hypothetical protein